MLPKITSQWEEYMNSWIYLQATLKLGEGWTNLISPYIVLCTKTLIIYTILGIHVASVCIMKWHHLTWRQIGYIAVANEIEIVIMLGNDTFNFFGSKNKGYLQCELNLSDWIPYF
jgi:hypothetical protein